VEQGKLEVARKMKDMGFPVAQVAKVTGLSQKTVKALIAGESSVTQ